MSAQPSRLAFIDLLRFLCALALVAYHYCFRGSVVDHRHPFDFNDFSGFFRYAYLGVPLFFMISGFVIAHSALGRSPLAFLKARAIRLYPAYILCCALTWLACRYWGDADLVRTPREFLVNLTLFGDFIHVPYVDQVYWTLTEEVKFYALITAVLIFKQEERLLLIMIAWLTVSAVHLLHRVPGSLLMGLATAPYFAAGVAFHDWQRNGLRRIHAVLLPASLALAVAWACREAHEDFLITSSVVPPGYTQEPWIIGIVLAGMFALFAGIAADKLSLRNAPWLAAAGGMTYPLYLLHNNIGFAILKNLPETNRWLAVSGVTLAMCVASYAVWKWWELPLMRGLKSLTGKTSPR